VYIVIKICGSILLIEHRYTKVAVRAKVTIVLTSISFASLSLNFIISPLKGKGGGNL
jgi:hypothetical protein